MRIDRRTVWPVLLVAALAAGLIGYTAYVAVRGVGGSATTRRETVSVPRKVNRKFTPAALISEGVPRATLPPVDAGGRPASPFGRAEPSYFQVPPEERPRLEPLDAISRRIASGEDAAVDAAIKAFTALADETGTGSIPLRQRAEYNWVPGLIDAGRYADAADVAHRVAGDCTDDLPTAERLLRLEVEALIKAGRGNEALSTAKSLFNVASMEGTADAIAAVALALEAARPRDPAAARRFMAEQARGARHGGGVVGGVTTAPTSRTAPATVAPVLAAVAVDWRFWLAKSEVHDVDEPNRQRQRGNCMLMAGRPRLAREAFIAAYEMSSDEEEYAAAQRLAGDLARCIKAEDGTIGRANAWIASLAGHHSPPVDRRQR